MGSVLSDFMAATSAVAKGDMTGATNAMRRAISLIDWAAHTPVHTHLGWSVYTHRGMSYGAVWVDTKAQRIVLADSTWQMIMPDDEVIDRFLTDMTAGANGMKFLPMDAGSPYLAAARAQADTTTEHVVVAKDAITDLGERVGALIAQASSMQGANVTDLQLRVFLERYGDAQHDLERLRERFDRLAQSVQTAGHLIAGLS